VTTNDEIGYVGDVINEITEGLKEKERLRQSLELAREVQQNLLPQKVPRALGLDIAGKSIYCDQTGGDYFDFLTIGTPDAHKVALLLGDVSGHGISSALLMATARAFLRLRSFQPGGAAEIVNDVNLQLVKDVGNSGQFMTLFYLVIDPNQGDLRWVRAGHDPAVFFDPVRNAFEELGGPGLALGVDATWRYQESQRKGLADGQIIVIGTDGIWESRNSQGKMFGKPAFLELIRKHATASAEDILMAVIDGVKHFQKGYQPEDDVTLVVVKI
jgi:sigma-B regulation protein RsbU (phosphoserine phosphatase)